MQLQDLKPNKGSKHKHQRLGRGNGSGRGNFSGRGVKGQKSRSGHTLRPGFEGGQTPLYRRMPKIKGFTSHARIDYQIINLSDLNNFEDGSTVDAAALKKAEIIKSEEKPVKLLGEGELSKKLTIVVNSISKSAEEKLKKQGSSLKILSKKEENKK